MAGRDAADQLRHRVPVRSHAAEHRCGPAVDAHRSGAEPVRGQDEARDTEGRGAAKHAVSAVTEQDAGNAAAELHAAAAEL